VGTDLLIGLTHAAPTLATVVDVERELEADGFVDDEAVSDAR
jgi:hypothetical protein